MHVIKRFIKPLGILLIIISVIIFFQYTQRVNSPLVQTTPHIILGAWTQGLFDPTTQKLHPEALIEFERLVHKPMKIAHYYRGWESLDHSDLIGQFTTLEKYGWTPMLSVNPYFFSECPSTSLPLYKAIANGACDNFLHKAGKNLRDVHKPFYLLFAWEMNNTDLEWSVTRSGSSPTDFIFAWRHIHDIFRNEGAKNIIWVFDPNVPNDSHIPYASLYPGDSYVDWVGLDGYNWGTTQSWSQWVSFSGVFTSAYADLLKVAPRKPMMIAEVNTTDQGGDKPSWYKDMFISQLPYHFSHIKAVVIFNEDKTTTEHVNWKVNISSESLKAFTDAIHAPFY